jgi:hypothetical protein
MHSEGRLAVCLMVFPVHPEERGDMVLDRALEHFIGLAYDSSCASAMILGAQMPCSYGRSSTPH